MKDANELNVEVEKIKSDIQLVRKDIEVIKNNHLYHIESDIRELNKRQDDRDKKAWWIAVILITQLAISVRILVLGS
jgi:hypothetical protein